MSSYLSLSRQPKTWWLETKVTAPCGSAGRLGSAGRFSRAGVRRWPGREHGSSSAEVSGVCWLAQPEAVGHHSLSSSPPGSPGLPHSRLRVGRLLTRCLVSLEWSVPAGRKWKPPDLTGLDAETAHDHCHCVLSSKGPRHRCAPS